MEDGIFFNQSKYIKEILKKFGLEDSKPMKTPMSLDTKLTKDEEYESVDSTKYRGMMGSLLYLTASRPNIMFSVCLCARFQEVPKTSHLEVVKHIFRYIKGTTHLGLWYPKGDDIETVVYADSVIAGDYVLDRKVAPRHCSYSDKWSLDYLEISSPTKGRYQTTPPSPSVIKTLIQTPRQGLVKIIRENVFCLGVHHDHVLACLCHMLYCIETSTKYNIAFFILKRMQSIQNTPKAILPYGMLLTRSFTHIMSNFPESSNDRYILCDHVMHPFAPHYERKTRSDHGTKRCQSSNPSSFTNILDHPSSSHHTNESNDGNDEESFHSNTSSPTQLVNSLSNFVPRVFENQPHENHNITLYETKIINHQSQHRDEHRKGLRSIGKALKNVMKSKKN
ncbi:hypothetical protein Tco_1360694 [Tanacetum coccineum]